MFHRFGEYISLNLFCFKTQVLKKKKKISGGGGGGGSGAGGRSGGRIKYVGVIRAQGRREGKTVLETELL